MASKLKGTKINFNRKTVSIGAYMHKRSWHITALADGEIVLTVSLSRPNYDAFEKVLSQFKGNYARIVYEAGPGGFDLYARLTADGIECIVTPPPLIPAQSGSRVKTDRKDSLKLAKLLESNMLKKVWVLSPEERAHRQYQNTVNRGFWGITCEKYFLPDQKALISRLPRRSHGNLNRAFLKNA